MLRGDTLVFTESVWTDLITGAIVGVPAGQQPPPGYVPLDITGFTIWFTAKGEFPDPDNRSVSQLDNASVGGITVLSANPGKFKVQMPALATRDFADSDVVLQYDIQIEDAGGRVTTIETGTLTVSPDVTRTST